MKTTAAFTLALLAVAVATANAGDVEDALKTLRAAKTCDEAFVGEGGDTSDTYRAYERLRGSADRATLEKLTDDDNPIVRCYAFRALVESHPDADVYAILLRHVDDVKELTTFRGCIQMDEPVGDVMIFEAWDRLTEDQRHDLAVRLAKDRDSKLGHRDRLLRTYEFHPADRPLLRGLAEDGDEAALVALARYRKPEDLALIRTMLRVDPGEDLNPLIPGLRAAELSPDPSFLPELKAIEPAARRVLARGRPHRLRSYCRALAAFENEDAASILRHLLAAGADADWARTALGEVVFAAVDGHRVVANVPVFEKLWTDYGRLSPEILAWLAEIRPDETRARAKASLAGRLGALPPDTIRALFAYVGDFDREFAVKALTADLKVADLDTANALASVAAAWRKPEFVGPLFAILTGHSNPHIYLGAARALLCFDDPEIDARLAAAVKETPALRAGWGSKRLAKLLEEKPRRWEE